MKLHLFIIDYDPIFRLLTTRLISKLEVPFLEIHECENGEIGIEALQKLSDTNEKIIIFLDINMPVLNGWDFLEILNQKDSFNIQNISIFIVSSSIDKNDILKAESYELVKQFIAKPMDLQTIKSIIIESN